MTDPLAILRSEKADAIARRDNAQITADNFQRMATNAQQTANNASREVLMYDAAQQSLGAAITLIEAAKTAKKGPRNAKPASASRP